MSIEIESGRAAMAPALSQLTDDNLAMLADYATTYHDEVLHALVGAVRLARAAERGYAARLQAEVEAYRSLGALKGLRPITDSDRPECLVDVLIQHPDLTGDYDRPDISMGFRRQDGMWLISDTREIVVQPTHWMPLPEPVWAGDDEADINAAVTEAAVWMMQAIDPGYRADAHCPEQLAGDTAEGV